MNHQATSAHGLVLAALVVAGAALISGCPRPIDSPEDPSSNGQAHDALTNGLIEVPDPLSGNNPLFYLDAAGWPVAGRSVTDARFGTSQVRVAETAGLRHEYSRHDPFNADRTRILLMFLPLGEWRVYRTDGVPYDTNASLLRAVSLEEPRWDPSNPALLWGFQEFRIVTVNVESGAVTAVKDFTGDPAVAPLLAANPDLYRITTRDEGEPSADYRYWALLLQGSGEDYRARFLITWDRQTDQILGIRALSVPESRIDWVGMSPKGTWVLVGGDWDNAAPFTGLTLGSRGLTEFHRLDYGIAHSDVGLDSDGREVIVMQNVQTDYIDLIPLDPSTKPILDAGGSYDGTGRVPLIRLLYDSGSPQGLNSGVHISCNFSGHCVISTFTEPNLREQNWLDRTITLVRLDPVRPRVFYLAKVYGTAGAYWEETQASISRDGSRVVWATNWGREIGQEHVWLMQLDMAAGWLSVPDD
jgi:hypothetical protein